MESILRPNEYKTYVFEIFNLQHFFSEGWAETHPQTLIQERLDDHFLDEICKLNGDKDFWQGSDPENGLDPYMARYVIMYFDHDYPARDILSDYLRDFMNRHRVYTPPTRPSSTILSEAGEVFGETPEKLQAMSARELTRLYRRLAQRHHPDAGAIPTSSSA